MYFYVWHISPRCHCSSSPPSRVYDRYVVCAYGYLVACAELCTYRSQRRTLGIFLNCVLPRSSPYWLGWMVSEAPGPTYLCSMCHWGYRHLSHAGLSVPAFMLAPQPRLRARNHLSSLCSSFRQDGTSFPYKQMYLVANGSKDNPEPR